MTVQEISAETVKGLIKLKLISGETLVGSIPFIWDVSTEVMILPFHHREKFKDIKIGEIINFDQIKHLMRSVVKNDIVSFELLEHEVKGMALENNKPTPNWLEITLINNDIPGYVSVQYKIPGYENSFNLGALKIKDGIITLPITFVFLSYAKEDKNAVLTVMEKLHNNGVITWFDEKDLLPGDDWEAKIEESIEKADYVFIFLSSKTIDKVGYKNKEVNYALNQYLMRPSGKRYIIPILLDECTPPREFNKIHWIKITETNWFNKILLSIGKQPK